MGLVGTLIWKGGMKIAGITAKANGLQPTMIVKGEEFSIYPKMYQKRESRFVTRERI